MSRERPPLESASLCPGTIELLAECEARKRDGWKWSYPVRSEGLDGQARGRGHPDHGRVILKKLAAGESIEQILDEHPRLSRDSVLAAISFASEALRADVVYPTRDTA